MLPISSDWRLDAIQLLGCIARRMIVSAHFVDQAFEATNTQKIIEIFTSMC